ncbi:MAG TPA: ATP-binding protein [Thermoanaerobaculia bacterium]
MTSFELERRRVLAEAGAAGEVLDELLAYNENQFDAARFEGLTFPLVDEPHIEAWREYAADAATRGFTTAVGERLPQLRFAIADGVSREQDYIAATRRGVISDAAPFLSLVSPDTVRLMIHQTIAGALPVILAGERRDFEDLVRAFSCRNEPDDVPDSMGACIVTGLNNWDRIRTYRKNWETAHPDATEAQWKEEFSRVVPRKELYQDRFLILSSGPYSAVPAEAAGFPTDEWQEKSVRIRLEHECTHYFTYRVLGSMRNNLLDEIIADYVGLMKVFGAYREDLALLFFGLESAGEYRSGGRLENYRGTPRLGDDAFAILQSLVRAAIVNIAEVERRLPADSSDPGGFAHRIVAYASSSLEILASSAEVVHSLVSTDRVAGADRIDLVIHDEPGLQRAIEEFRSFAGRHRLPIKSVSDVCIVLDELLSNVIKYGFKVNRGQIELSLSLSGDELTAAIVDDSPPFNVLEAPEPQTGLPAADRPVGGLGIHIVKQLSDEIRYSRSDGQNHLFIRKRVKGESSRA